MKMDNFYRRISEWVSKNYSQYYFAIIFLGLLIVITISYVAFGYSKISTVTEKAKATPSQLYSGPIIDSHAHAFPLSYYETIGWPVNRWTGEPTPNYDDQSLIAATLAAMDNHNVALAVISGRFEELDIWSGVSRERFLFSPTTHGDYEQGISNVEDRLRDKSIVSIGEMFTQYYGMPFNESLAMEYYALADKYDVPVTQHVGFTDPEEIRSLGMMETFFIKNGEPIELESILKQHPNLKLQISHGGYPFLDQTLIIMQLYENVYIDLASVAYVIGKDAFHQYLLRLVQGGPGFSKRIMFGSDFYLWPETQISLTIDAINTAEFLTIEEKSDIFCGNAARFYNLSPSVCNY